MLDTSQGQPARGGTSAPACPRKRGGPARAPPPALVWPGLSPPALSGRGVFVITEQYVTFARLPACRRVRDRHKPRLARVAAPGLRVTRVFTKPVRADEHPGVWDGQADSSESGLVLAHKMSGEHPSGAGSDGRRWWKKTR